MQNAYEQLATQMDKFIRYDQEYHGVNREHSWEELAERWIAAQPDLTMDNFTILMKRGSIKLGDGEFT